MHVSASQTAPTIPDTTVFPDDRGQGSEQAEPEEHAPHAAPPAERTLLRATRVLVRDPKPQTAEPINEAPVPPVLTPPAAQDEKSAQATEPSFTEPPEEIKPDQGANGKVTTLTTMPVISHAETRQPPQDALTAYVREQYRQLIPPEVAQALLADRHGEPVNTEQANPDPTEGGKAVDDDARDRTDKYTMKYFATLGITPAPYFEYRLEGQKSQLENSSDNWGDVSGDYSGPDYALKSAENASDRSEREHELYLKNLIDTQLTTNPGRPVVLLDMGGGHGQTWCRLAKQYEQEIAEGRVVFVVSNAKGRPGDKPLQYDYRYDPRLKNIHKGAYHYDSKLLSEAQQRNLVHFVNAAFAELQDVEIELPDGTRMPLRDNVTIAHEVKSVVHSWVPELDIIEASKVVAPDGVFLFSKNTISEQSQSAEENEKVKGTSIAFEALQERFGFEQLQIPDTNYSWKIFVRSNSGEHPVNAEPKKSENQQPETNLWSAPLTPEEKDAGVEKEPMPTYYVAVESKKGNSYTDTVVYKVIIDEVPYAVKASGRGGNITDEAEIVARLDHPHILSFLHAGPARLDTSAIPGDPNDGAKLETIQFPFMEDTLASKLQQLTDTELSHILLQQFEAVKYLHSVGIAHRDMKAENILIEDGNSYLIDFGRAAAQLDSGDETYASRAKQIDFYLFMEMLEEIGRKKGIQSFSEITKDDKRNANGESVEQLLAQFGSQTRLEQNYKKYVNNKEASHLELEDAAFFDELFMQFGLVDEAGESTERQLSQEAFFEAAAKMKEYILRIRAKYDPDAQDVNYTDPEATVVDSEDIESDYEMRELLNPAWRRMKDISSLFLHLPKIKSAYMNVHEKKIAAALPFFNKELSLYAQDTSDLDEYFEFVEDAMDNATEEALEDCDFTNDQMETVGVLMAYQTHGFLIRPTIRRPNFALSGIGTFADNLKNVVTNALHSGQDLQETVKNETVKKDGVLFMLMRVHLDELDEVEPAIAGKTLNEAKTIIQNGEYTPGACPAIKRIAPLDDEEAQNPDAQEDAEDQGSGRKKEKRPLAYKYAAVILKWMPQDIVDTYVSQRAEPTPHHEGSGEIAPEQDTIPAFQVLEKVGAGASKVYKAVVDGEAIALKTSALSTNVEEEYKIVSMLHHDHILPLLAYGKAILDTSALPNDKNNGDEVDYLKYRFIRDTLTAKIAQLTHDELRKILHQQLDALTYIHSQGFINGDIKSDNILIDDNNDSFLTDFNWAESIDHLDPKDATKKKRKDLQGLLMILSNIGHKRGISSLADIENIYI